MPTTRACVSCVAYRHLLKGVARAENEKEMRTAALLALDYKGVDAIGKLLHQVVKFGVHVARAKSLEEHETAMKNLKDHVAQLPADGAVMRSWEL